MCERVSLIEFFKNYVYYNDEDLYMEDIELSKIKLYSDRDLYSDGKENFISKEKLEDIAYDLFDTRASFLDEFEKGKDQEILDKKVQDIVDKAKTKELVLIF